MKKNPEVVRLPSMVTLRLQNLRVKILGNFVGFGHDFIEFILDSFFVEIIQLPGIVTCRL